VSACSRPGKYPSAATFPIVCGRRLPNGAYQAPTVALVADFGAGQGGASAEYGSAGGGAGAFSHVEPSDIRLSLRELRVLLHEWGHAMHALVSRTKYQHVSGTR
jgi:mitochondrial intermediate peptidase